MLTEGALRARLLRAARPCSTGLPRDHQLWREELFVPIVAVETVDSLDEALARANDTRFGLTAGLFSREQAEIDAFLERIEAGVVYVNRAAGATTGAWPGVQPFGGWKGSGSTGQEHRRPLHPALLPARAEPDAVRMTAAAPSRLRLALEALAAQPISIVTDPPGPRAREMIARALPHLSPSLIHCLPADGEARVAGCMVEDVDGNVFLDAEAGVATASTGHCHPAVAEAIAAQAEVLIHICGTDFHYPGYGEMCEKLGALAQRIGPNTPPLADVPHQLGHRGGRGGDQAGAPPHQAAGADRVPRRLPRAHAGVAVADRQQVEIPAGASGRCCPASSTRDYGDAASVEELFTTVAAPDDVAAIVVEPVLGEGGYIVPPRRLPAGPARDRATATASCWCSTRCRAGMGRTGKMFAAEHTGVVPDVVRARQGDRLGHAAGRDDGAASRS